MSYKAGDRFLSAAMGRTHQPAIFFDSTGRSYVLPAHSLPSARGQGEPLSGRLTLSPGASILSVLMGDPEQALLIASDAGYGFIARLEDLLTRNRNGKAVLNLPPGASPLSPIFLDDVENKRLVAVTNEGRMLVFPVKDLPALSRGKGNKIIQISAARAKVREELLIHLSVMLPEDSLEIQAGKRQLILKPGNLAQFVGFRGRRGQKLPRGYRTVDRLTVIQSSQKPVLS
jgi:topoisomerase-4 subunit A